MDALYRVDFTPELDRLSGAILGIIRYISPGLWMMWPRLPRPGYRHAIHQMDAYLYRIIRERHARMQNLPQSSIRRETSGDEEPPDLMGMLIEAGLDDDLIRDQLLTMLIAGHDTGTALMAWTLIPAGRPS